MPSWKKVAVSGSDASFNSVYAATSITAQSFTGSLFGTASNAVSSSYTLESVSASYALTASYVNPLNQNVSITGSLSTTGSNTLIGNTVLSGSIAVSGSQTFTGVNTVIGNSYLTGSLNITGSTTQIGDNSLLGTTTLSGSITISGSLSPTTPTVKVYGSMDIGGHIKFEPVTANIDSSISASYIYVSGSTNDLYFSQNAKGYSNITRLRWLEGNLYTGLLNGGLITSQSSTVYQVSSGSGIIVNLNASLNDNPYPTVQYLNWGNLTQSIAPLSASYDQAFVGIQSNGTIYQQGTPIGAIQNDSVINIGTVLFQNHSTINGVKTQPYVAYGITQRQDIFTTAFGPLKLSGYTLAASGSSTGSLIVASGTAYCDGANYTVDPNNPSYVTDSGTNTSKIFRYYDSGSGTNNWVYNTNNGVGYATIDPGQYSNNGTLSAVANNRWSIQRCFWYPNSVTKAIVVYYGNAIYTTQADAIANIQYESFVEAPNTAANAIYLGALVVRGNAVFTDTNSFSILAGGLFRQVGGSGGGGSVVTQTLTGLSDVNITGPTDLQPFVYSSTQAKWINSSAISASVAGNATSATSASYAATASRANATATTPFVVGETSVYYGTINSSTAGSNNLFNLSTGSFTAGTFQYTVYSGSSARAGQVIASWNNGSIQYTDFSSPDNGSTTAVTMSAVIVASNLQFNAQTGTPGWTIKTQGTLI